MRTRGLFLGALHGVLGPALVAAFFMENLVPMLIWVGTTFVVVADASRRN
ncbi:hypothetical protein QT726_22340 [Xanthomonas citri pv. citri]